MYLLCIVKKEKLEYNPQGITAFTSGAYKQSRCMPKLDGNYMAINNTTTIFYPCNKEILK